MLTIGNKTALPESHRWLSDMPGPRPYAERSKHSTEVVFLQAETLG
ncbi:MAG: hypothetical protein K2N95_09745 [Lachnospiraceae bacterium]|nr:hypothetical protein [Lachnospiraceae bacterium]